MRRRVKAFQRGAIWIPTAFGLALAVVAGSLVAVHLVSPSGQTTTLAGDGPDASASEVLGDEAPAGASEMVRRASDHRQRKHHRSRWGWNWGWDGGWQWWPPRSRYPVPQEPRVPVEPLPPVESAEPERPGDSSGSVPARTDTLCGVSYLPENGQSYADGLAAANRRYNGLEMLRIFDWEPSPWPGRAGRFGGPVVLSMKLKPSAVLAGKHDDAVRSWFENAPRDQDIYWSLHHEPEDNLEDGEFTSEEYKAAWRRLEKMADQADNPRLWSTLILMDWTLDPRSGRDWRDFYAGDDVIDVLAFDVYNHGYKQDPPEYYSAEYQLERIVELADDLDKPFGIGELGSIRLPDDRSGQGRAAWLRDMIGYLDKHNALWVAYYDIDYSDDSDYRLRDDPSVSVWRDFCS